MPRSQFTVRGRGLLLATVAAGAVAFGLSTAPGASADGGRISAQYQGYAASGGQDPYAGSNPQDVHVAGFGGQPVVTGLIRLNLESLPTGSTVDGLTLVLTPNSSASDNVEPAQATMEACLLDQPLTSDGYQANPPSWDCNAVHVNGEPQADGTWLFALAPLAQRWANDGNTGLALVAYPAPDGTSVAASPTAWSVGFDHTRTAGQVDYQPPSGSSQTFFALPPQGSSGSTSTLPSVSSGTAVQPVPAVAPAPPVAAAPQPSPALGAGGGASRSPAPVQPRAATAPAPHVVAQWVWLTACLAGAALLMLLVSAMQQVLRGGPVDMRLRVGSALRASRSQLATPVAVLALASVFALGFTGQLAAGQVAGGAQAGGAGGAASGGAGASGGSALSGGATPGAGPSGVAGGAAAPGSQQAGGAAGASSAQAAALAASNGGLDGPGVTSTTVRLGFIDVVNSQAANNAFGVKVASQGPQQSIEDTMVDWLNHHGGIAGRQIQAVHITQDNGQNETNPNANEAACHTMTEDYHVFAVIGGGGPPDDANANACYAESGTLNFDDQQASVDLAFLKQASPYVWFIADTALDRTMQWEVAGLQSRGFFSGGPSYKLGVIIAQDPVNERVWQQVTLPALQSAGVAKPDTFEVPHDTVSNLANTMKQAVAHFQLDGVTNVIFQGGGNYGAGSYALLFTLDAESQHYNPRYGFNTDDATTALIGNVPEDQFKDALAVGTIPGIDTDDAHYAPWPYTPAEKKCASIEANTYQPTGRSATSSTSALEMLDICSTMLALQQGAQSLVGQPLNAQLFANSFMHLGGNVFDAMPYAAQVGADHWDMPGGYRLLHAVLNCEGSNACFEYDNATLYH